MAYFALTSGGMGRLSMMTVLFTAKTPTIVVRDSQNRIIPESEYTIELPANRIEVGEYEVTVTDKTGGNYEFTTPVTGKFKIVSVFPS